MEEFRFSIFISPIEDYQSQLFLGGYKQELIGDGYEIIAHPITGSFHWTIQLLRIKVNGNWFNTKSNNALVDTGSSYIILNKGN